MCFEESSLDSFFLGSFDVLVSLSAFSFIGLLTTKVVLFDLWCNLEIPDTLATNHVERLKG